MDHLSSLLMLAQVLFSFLLLFIWLPSLVIRFDKRDSSVLDRIFIPLIHSSVFIISAVFLLVGLRLFETLSIVAFCIGGLVFFHWLDVRTGKKEDPNLLAQIYDSLDSKESLKERLQRIWFFLVSSMKKVVSQLMKSFQEHPIALPLILLTLLYATYIRFKHVVTHYYFGSSDAYVHMMWSKAVMRNTLFLDGLYPFGQENLVAAMGSFFLIDLYPLVRYIGSIGGVLIVLSIGYAVHKFGANLYAVFLSMAVYTFSSSLPSIPWRQISFLPMEYAAVFFLPGIVFWTLFCQKGGRKYLLLAAECLLLTIFIHPIATVVIAIAIVVIGIYYIQTLWKRNDLWISAIYFVIASVLGLLPLGIGMVAGFSFFGASVNYLQENIQTAFDFRVLLDTIWLLLVEPKNIIIAVIVLSLIVWISRMYYVRRQRMEQPGVGIILFAILTFLFLLIYKSNEIGLPAFIPLDRFGVFYAIYIAMFIGLLLLTVSRIVEGDRKKRYWSAALSIILIAAIFMNGQYLKPPVGDQFQYDEAIQTYLKIKKEFSFGDWTIVSPVDEFPLVRSYGFHTNNWEFVLGIEPDSPSEVLFNTTDGFLYVEIVPLFGNPDKENISKKDALLPFPVHTAGELTDFYYRSENRKILQAKLYNWIKWYSEAYPQNISLYYSAPHFEVYHITPGVINNQAVVIPKLPKGTLVQW